MIKNFDKLKTQLIELAEALNKFQSEAVQLKLIEVLFGEAEQEKSVEKVAEKPTVEVTEKRRRPGRPPKIKKEETEEPVKEMKAPKAPKTPRTPAVPKADKEIKKRAPRQRSTERPGPRAALNQLLDSDFFSQKRTIGDIVAHFSTALNHQYKSTDLSGTLAKLAKDGKLSRAKNPESNQFEYIKS